MRSQLVNGIIPRDGSALVSAVKHYNELFSETYEFGHRILGVANKWLRFKLLTQQYLEHRRKAQSLTSFSDLQDWLNETWYAIHINPINVLNEEDLSARYRPLEYQIERVVARDDLDYKVRITGWFEEEVQGQGWLMTLRVYANDVRYRTVPTLTGLRGLGLYVLSSDYETDNNGRNFFRLTIALLVRDFKLTDEEDPRWFRDPMLGIFDDDEDDLDIEDHLSPAERRAREAEEGWLDDEIKGLDTYDDFSR
jgi:hypothetical protein